MPADLSEPSDTVVEAFTIRWKNSGAAERSNSQSFLKEFCALLSLPQPDPKGPDENLHRYLFEKTVRQLPSGLRHSILANRPAPASIRWENGEPDLRIAFAA